jgi:hypothetical protein
VSTSRRHAFQPEPMVLVCPRCSAQHEDFGEFAHRPHRTHRTHRCLFCKHEWRPFLHTTVGVALGARGNERFGSLIVPLAVFEEIDEYSCSLPTGPSSGRYWRRREPYVGEDRTSRQYFCIAQGMPDDRPGEISLIWRRLLVAEWLIGDALGEVAR